MANCMKYTLFVFNMLFLIAGLGLLGLGIWVLYEGSKFFALLEASLLPKIAYMMIGVGCFVAFVSLMGCWGALKENRCLLGIYFSFLLVVCLLEAAVAILGFMFYDNVDTYPRQYIGNVILNLYDMPGYELLTVAIDTMQKNFLCCGYEGPYDWANSNSFNSSHVAVPISCCINQNELQCNHQIGTNNVYLQGCVKPLVAWLKTNLEVIGGVAVSVVFIQLLGMSLAICLCKKAGNNTYV